VTSDTLVEKSDIRRAATRNMVRAKETRRPASLAMMESRPANATHEDLGSGLVSCNSGFMHESRPDPRGP